MLTLYEISEKYRVSLRKLRKMHKAGLLRCEGSADPLADDIRVMLSSGQRLSVKHLVALIDTPGLIFETGPEAEKAREQLDAIGNPVPAPEALWPDIAGSAANDPESLARLIAWAKETIPKQGQVSHHYLAVRLILGVPEEARKHEYPRLNRVFLNMRRRPDFAEWWHVEPLGAKRATWYHQPKGFDL